MRHLLLAPLLPMMLGGCVTSDAAAPGPVSGECDASSLQSLVGQKTSPELGGQVKKKSGAQIFRWLPAGMAVTMEYNASRVNVAYDEQMTITSINCG